MPKAHFSHVDAWVFDLDNTLYPAHVRLFDQIDVKITRYVMDALGLDEAEADHLRQHYWQAHGTTLAGLMAEHGLDPDPYLVAVHDIDFSVLPPDADLAARIKALPGRRVVYTNGSAPYARQVIKARGLSGLFDAVYGVEHAGYRPKPERAAFEAVFAQDGIDPTRAAMFEDEPRNLTVPHAMGMRTVLIAPHRAPGDHIQFHSQDLGAFLSQL
ncbi:MAG: pyrimidine 5'-nucleotidase [Pseudomonadota bacterium]